MSKEPKRFKQTEIGELPEEWEVVKLGDVARVFAGSSAPQKREYFENGIFPFVRVQDLARYGQTRCLREVADKVNERAVQEHHMVLARKGTIVFPKSGAALEKNHRAILGVDAYIVSHLAAVEVNPEKVSNEFLFWWLCRVDMASLNPNPGYPSIRLEEIKALPIPLPPLEEQRRIAGVLRLVDRVAEKTKRIINIYEKAKKFALKHLLTRGIGHTRFKQTEIGELPEEWEVVRLGDVFSEQKNRINPQDYAEEIFALYSIPAYDQDCKPEILNGRQIGSQKFIFEPPAILLSRLNPRNYRVWLVQNPLGYKEIASTEFVIMKPNMDIDVVFGYYLCLSPFVRNRIQHLVEGTTGSRQRIDAKDVFNIPIPLPPLEEQKQIAEMLSTIDAAIENERKYLGVLEKCKKWMLDNLLTGKVRLPPEVDEILKGVLPDAF